MHLDSQRYTLPRSEAVDVSVCAAVWQEHGAPNLATLTAALKGALDGLSHELVVVLNGVTAEQAEAPESAVVVPFEVNQGVPRGWNAAARQASGHVLAFMNDDVIPGRGSLRLLHDVLAENDQAGMVGPVGTQWDLERAEHRDTLDTSDLRPGELRECNVVSGFMFATRRETFVRAGGFDEAYTPCLFEEVDYATTVRCELGLRCFAIAGVPFEHEYDFSSANPWQRIRYGNRSALKGYIARRNRRRFRRKWGAKLREGALSAVIEA
jgi:GT2 family glycosyltransferase